MAEGAPDASKGLRGLIPSDEVTRHLVNLPLCTEAGYIRIRLGLGLGWARVGLERIRNGPSVGGSFAAMRLFVCCVMLAESSASFRLAYMDTLARLFGWN